MARPRYTIYAIVMPTAENGKVNLANKKAGFTYVTTTELKGSNGVIHVIDAVVLPKQSVTMPNERSPFIAEGFRQN